MKAQYIQGYWRGQKVETTQKEDGGVLLAVALLGSSVGVFSIVYYKVTLAVALAFIVMYLGRQKLKEFRERENKEKLVVNENGKCKVIYI